MKTVKEALLERRSVRRYTRDKIDPEKLEFIFEAIRNTPTSYNGQQFSVIVVNDQTVKEQIYAITGQKQIKTCATFMVFCLDFHKLALAARIKGIAPSRFESTMNGYTVGVIDASLAMMNAVTAATAQGLGTCCIGYARTANPEKLSQMLGLPSGVAIVCGLTVGNPDETPDMKPKLPLQLVIHHERYSVDESMKGPVKEYDDLVYTYNQSRAGDKTDNDWAGHINSYHANTMEKDIREYLLKQIGLG